MTDTSLPAITASATPVPRARGGVCASVTASIAFAALFGVPGALTGLEAPAAFGWRLLAALPFLVIILFALRQWASMGRLLQRLRANPGLIPVLALNSLLFGLQTFLFAWGPLTGNALAVSFGYFLLPLVLVAIGVLAFRERLSPLGAVAVGFAAVGVAVALFAGASVSWATFAVAFGYPAYFVLRRTFALDSPAAQLLEIVLLAPLGLILALQPAAREAIAAHPANWGGILALGLLTAVGFCAYTLAQRALPMGLFGMLGYLEPILLVLVSIAVLGEPLGRADALSYGAIGLAIAALAADGARRARARRGSRVRRGAHARRGSRGGRVRRGARGGRSRAAARGAPTPLPLPLPTPLPTPTPTGEAPHRLRKQPRRGLRFVVRQHVMTPSRRDDDGEVLIDPRHQADRGERRRHIERDFRDQDVEVA